MPYNKDKKIDEDDTKTMILSHLSIKRKEFSIERFDKIFEKFDSFLEKFIKG
jgi:hypothetical protein